MVVLLTCKNEDNPIKNEGTRVLTRLYVIFSDAQGQLTPKSAVEFCRNSNTSKLLWLSLLPARMKKDPIENEGHRVLTRFPHYKSMGIFSNAQGQLTPQSVVESGRNSNLSEKLWLSSLPARMKKIQLKMKVQECEQDFPHYKPMGAIGCHGNQSSDPIWPRT